MKPFYITILSALIIQACSNSEGRNDSAKVTESIPVTVMALVREDMKPEIQTSGLFTTDDETMLSFKTGGIIERVYVKEGDAIRKGQLLASLNLTEIEAQVAQARLAHDKAKRDFSRVENLYKDSVATLEQFQNASTGMEVASRQLEAANFNRSYSEIRALQNGFVLKKMASEGQVISPGMPVFQTNGASKGKWILKAGVGDRDWSSIKIGDKATITTDATEGKSYSALVTHKSESTDMNGAFMVELSLIETDQGLASGLFGKAIIHATQKISVWKIPYDALLDGDAQQGFVFVTSDERTSHRIPVVVGGIEKDHVLIQSGLEDAKWLITSGSAYLKEGSPIKIQK